MELAIFLLNWTKLLHCCTVREMAMRRVYDADDVREAVGKTIRNKGLAPILLIGFLILALWSSFYTVPTDSEAVVLRFGKEVRTAESGLNFKMPFGIEKTAVVPVKRQLKLEFGFATEGATNKYQFSKHKQEQVLEVSMITGDRNAALVEWVIQYRVSEPSSYLFRVRNPEDTLRDASESVMREVVGDRTVDEVLTIGRQGIESEALERLQNLVNAYGLGLGIDQVQLKNVNPPRPVQASFNEVNQAQQERERAINIARGQYNKSVPRTRGEADRKIAEAEGYAVKRVNEAQGDAARFTSLYTEYAKATQVTRERLYQEAMSDILGQVKSKVILDGDSSKVLPLLPLNGLNNLGK